MKVSSRFVFTVMLALAAWAVAPVSLMADPMGCVPVNTTNPGGKTVVTTSCSQTQVVQTMTATNSVNTYQTTITAELGNGMFLFDASFDLPYSDASVQAAVVQAEADLVSAGAASYSGPTLVSNTQSTSSSVTTVNSTPVDSGTFVDGTVTTYGPGIILEGNLGLCQGLVSNDSVTGSVPYGCSGPGIPFDVFAGQTDININVDEIFDVNQVTTTTNTTLTSQTYNLNGVASVAATPEPGSLYLLGTGLLSIAGAARRRLQ